MLAEVQKQLLEDGHCHSENLDFWCYRELQQGTAQLVPYDVSELLSRLKHRSWLLEAQMDQLQPEHHFPYVVHVLKFLNCVDFAQELTQLLEDVQGVSEPGLVANMRLDVGDVGSLLQLVFVL